MKQPFVKYLSLGLCLLTYTAHQAQNNTTNSTNEAWQDTPCTNLLPGDAAGDTGCVTFVYGGQNVTYRTVRAADGKVWLQQNLGSTQVATSKEDEAAYGDVFQWGRWDDGHQKRNSTVIPAAPTPNNPLGVQTPTNGYIAATTGWWSGANMQLTDLWTAETPATVTATNGCDPCKALGNQWKMPTEQEWKDLQINENIDGVATAFSSHLKLAAGGFRSSSTGAYTFVGTRGYYWSATTANTGGKYFYISTAANPSAGAQRGQGASVRCLLDESLLVVTSVEVAVFENASATITTLGGTLQLVSNVFPALLSQDINWSVSEGADKATVNDAGIVTGIANGTVKVRATSIIDPTKFAEIEITIAAVASVAVTTQNNVPAKITNLTETLPLVAAVLPATMNQQVTWSVVEGGAYASVSETGVVTGIAEGTAKIRATSVFDTNKHGDLNVVVALQTAAIDEFSKEHISVYPNPTTGWVTLRADRDIAKIELFDLTGKKVVTSDQAAFDISHLAAGMYQARVVFDNEKQIFVKIIKK